MPYNLRGMTEYDLSPELRARIDATLEADERLVLVARPDWWWASPLARFFIIFGAIWVSLLAVMTVCMVNAPDTTEQDYLFLIPFWVVGIGMIVGVLLSRAAGKREAYLITDKRAIALRSKVLFWPLKPDMVKAVEEHRNGYGDIVLGYKSYQINNKPAPDGFVGVPQVREVLAALQAQIKATCAVAYQPVKWQTTELTPEEKRKVARTFGILGVFAALFGSLFFAVGLYMFIQHRQLVQEGMPAVARVVKIVVDYDSDHGKSYFPVVQFTDAAGKSHTVQSSRSNRNLCKGEQLNILYRPSNPQHFEIEGEDATSFSCCSMAVGGIIMLTGGWLFVRMLRQRKRQSAVKES